MWGALGLTQACVPHLRRAADRQRRRVDRVHPLDVDAQDPAQRGRVLVVEGGAAHRGAVARARARAGGRPRERVAPGWIGGPSVDIVHRLGVRSSGASPSDDVRAEIEARIPLGLIPPQDDIAHSVVFFASPWSNVITGQTLDVNGGEWFGVTRPA